MHKGHYKSRLLIYYLLTCCIFLISCQNNSKNNNEKQIISDRGIEDKNNIETQFYDFTKNVKLEKELKLSEIADSVEYIPLDKSVMLKGINKLVVNDSNIYIRDVAYTYIFDSNGKFIKSLYEVGRGPEEAYGTDFIVDGNKNIYVGKRWTKNLLVYSSTAIIKKEKKYPVFEWHFHYFNNFLIFSNMLTPDENLFYVYRIADDSLIYKHPFRYNHLPAAKSGTSGSVWFDNFHDKLFLKEIVCDTVYSTENFSDFAVEYVFNFGSRTFKPEDYYNGKLLPFDNKEFIATFKVTSYYLLMLGMDNGKECMYLVNKTNGKIKKSFNLTFANDIDGGSMLHFIVRHNYDDNILYFFIQPYELIENKNKISLDSKLIKVANESVENDNPILVKVNLKKQIN